MKRLLEASFMLTLGILFLTPGASASGALDGFLGEVDVSARADLGSFKADLSLTFHVPDHKVDSMFEVMSKPSDVYMCLRIGEVAHQPLDRVVKEYMAHRGQGWGVIAKNLGIRPGSKEFHALKAQRMGSHSKSGGPTDKGKGKGKGGRK